MLLLIFSLGKQAVHIQDYGQSQKTTTVLCFKCLCPKQRAFLQRTTYIKSFCLLYKMLSCRLEIFQSVLKAWPLWISASSFYINTVPFIHLYFHPHCISIPSFPSFSGLPHLFIHPPGVSLAFKPFR